MKKSYLFLLLCFISFGACAQMFYKGTMSIAPNKDISFIGTCQDSVVFENVTIQTSSIVPYLFLSKLDSNFNLQWFKNLGSAFWELDINDIKLANDTFGNTYLACNFSGEITLDTGVTINGWSIPYGSIVLAKYDIMGHLLWHRQSKGTIYANKIGLGLDTSGIIHLSSEFTNWVSFSTDTVKDVTGSEGTFFVTFDSSGNLVSKAVIHGEKQNKDYATDPYGNTFVAGNCVGNQYCGADTGYYPVSNSYLAECNSAVTPTWQRVPIGTDHVGAAVGAGPDGKPVTAGALKGDLYFNTAPPVFAVGADYNTFIVKYNDTGNAIWSIKALSSDVNPELEVDGLNNIYIAGGRRPDEPVAMEIDTSIVTTKQGGQFVVKLDSSGKVLCNINLKYCIVPTITFDKDNYFYLTGRQESLLGLYMVINSDSLVTLGNDYYIAKFDRNCQLMHISQIGTPLILLENVRHLGTSLAIDIFPNPANDKLFIQFAEGLQVPAMIRLYDITGREVHTAGNVRARAEVDIAGLPKGLYLVEVKTAENRAVKKFIKN